TSTPATARGWRGRTNALRATVAQIGTEDVAVLRRRVDDVKVRRIDSRLESITAAKMEPILRRDADASARRARSAPTVVVLQAGVHEVRMTHVGRHPVRERR